MALANLCIKIPHCKVDKVVGISAAVAAVAEVEEAFTAGKK